MGRPLRAGPVGAQPTLQLVATGLDPVVHADLSSRMDCRIKSGNDDLSEAVAKSFFAT